MARHDKINLPAGEITIAGRTFASQKAAADHFGRALPMYDYYRKKFGASFEDWVTGKLDSKIKAFPISFEGKTYSSKTALCAAYGQKYGPVKALRSDLRLRYFQTALRLHLLKQKAKSRGSLSVHEDALIKAAADRRKRVKADRKRFPKSLISNKTAVRFRGVDYESYHDLCAAYQMNYDTVRTLRRHHLGTFEEVFSEALRLRDEREIRAFGSVYSTISDLARHKHVDAVQLRRAIQASPEMEIEEIVRALIRKTAVPERNVRSLPEDPVLFGWRFRSWKDAWEYWMPLGVSRRRFYDHLAEGQDIDARCQHEILIQAERGNLTEDLRKADQLSWTPDQGAPLERVEVLTRFSLPERLAAYSLISMENLQPRRKIKLSAKRSKRLNMKAKM